MKNAFLTDRLTNGSTDGRTYPHIVMLEMLEMLSRNLYMIVAALKIEQKTRILAE